jgi:DNA-binding CsgD family transcriptional regulator
MKYCDRLVISRHTVITCENLMRKLDLHSRELVKYAIERA